MTALEAAGTQQTDYAYGPFGTLSSRTSDDGTSDSITNYDALLRPTAIVDRRGNVRVLTRDAAERITHVSITPAAGTVGPLEYDFVRDGLGRISHATNGLSSVDRVFNSLDQLELETVTSTGTSITKSVTVERDAQARMAHLIYPQSTPAVPDKVDYTYDTVARLTAVGHTNGSIVHSVITRTYAGERLLTESGPVRSTTYGYDTVGRVEAISHSRGTTPVASFLLGYDDVDNVTSLYRAFYNNSGQQFSPSAFDRFAAYIYDVYNELTFAAKGLSLSAYLAQNWGAATEQSTVHYNNVWSRQSASSTTASGTTTATYSSNGTNEYTGVTGTSGITYDASGNLLAMSPGQSATYDAYGRPISFTDGSVAMVHTYDPFGRRMETYVPATGARERITYLGWQALESQTTGTGASTKEFVYDRSLDGILEMRDSSSGTNYAYYLDERGSPIGLTDSAGGLVNSYRYSDFGRRQHVSPSTGALISSSAVGQPVGFAGRWSVGTSERFVDYRMRTYDSDWGRFLQPDPLGYPGGTANRYHMTHNNPWSHDPLGLFDDGDLHDSADAWTHVGITQNALQQVDMSSEDAEAMQGAVEANWAQDNSQRMAGLGDPDNGMYHAFGSETSRNFWLQYWHNTATGSCNIKDLGEALHYLQDWVAHRDQFGRPYNEYSGQASGNLGAAVGVGFNPDAINPLSAGKFAELQFERVTEARHKSAALIQEFYDSCGDDALVGSYSELTNGEQLFIISRSAPSSAPVQSATEDHSGGGGKKDGDGPATGSGTGSGTGAGKIGQKCAGGKKKAGKGPASGGPGPSNGAGGGGPSTPGPSTGMGVDDVPPMCWPSEPGPNGGGKAAPPPAPGPAPKPSPPPPSTGSGPHGTLPGYT